jgi:hypothetical protein
MNIQETVQLIEALRASGVTHYKSLEHDITLRELNGSVVNNDSLTINASQPIVSETPPANPEQAMVSVIEQDRLRKEKQDQETATARIKDMIATMAMSPAELAEKMYGDQPI